MNAVDYDELYHRALTGRGEPISGDEVIALLDALEEWTADYEKLEKQLSDAEKELRDAWIVPQHEPMRPCTMCRSGHDRGDGRCENHGRLILHEDDKPIHIQALVGFRKPKKGQKRAAEYRVTFPAQYE